MRFSRRRDGHRRPDEDRAARHASPSKRRPRHHAAGRNRHVRRRRASAARSTPRWCSSRSGVCRPRWIWSTRSACTKRCARSSQAGLAETAHDLSDGGLAVALAECSFGPAGIGAAVDLSSGLGPSCCCSTKARRAYWFPLRTSRRNYANRARATQSSAPVIGARWKARLTIRNQRRGTARP